MLRYINKQKTVAAFANEKPEWLMPHLGENSSSNGIIANEEDLRKLKVTHRGYYQENSSDTKGAIQWDEEGKAIINLFKGADASTVIHETGHYFVEAFMKESALENADPKLVLVGYNFRGY